MSEKILRGHSWRKQGRTINGTDETNTLAVELIYSSVQGMFEIRFFVAALKDKTPIRYQFSIR